MSNNMIHTELPFGLTMEDLSARYETHSDSEEFKITLHAYMIHLNVPNDLRVVVDLDLKTEHKNTGDMEFKSLSSQSVDLEASEQPITNDENFELEKTEVVVGRAAHDTWLRYTEDSIAKAERELKSGRTRNISAAIGIFSLGVLTSRLVSGSYDSSGDFDIAPVLGTTYGGFMSLVQELQRRDYRKERLQAVKKAERIGRFIHALNVNGLTKK